MGLVLVMSKIFPRREAQSQASIGTHSQAEMPLVSPVADIQVLPRNVVAKVTFTGSLNEAVRNTGMDDQDIAEAINISPAYMSRFMRGAGQSWARRLVEFMRVTHSIAPLQWLAEQMGCDVLLRSSNDARIKALEAELQAIRGVA